MTVEELSRRATGASTLRRKCGSRSNRRWPFEFSIGEVVEASLNGNLEGYARGSRLGDPRPRRRAGVGNLRHRERGQDGPVHDDGGHARDCLHRGGGAAGLSPRRGLASPRLALGTTTEHLAGGYGPPCRSILGPSAAGSAVNPALPGGQPALLSRSASVSNRHS